MTIYKEIKNSLKACCERSTGHGIANISRSKYTLLRVMWFFVFLISLSYCSYVIVKSLIEYFKFQTNVSIKVMLELPANFPAVTICNINPLNENRAIDLMKLVNQYQNCFNFTSFIELSDEEYSNEFWKCINATDKNSALDSVVDRMKRFIANEIKDEESRNYFGFDLDYDMLISCQYNSKPCSGQNFTKFWSNYYGNCYSFNDGTQGEIHKTSVPGSDYGLKMELVVRKCLSH